MDPLAPLISTLHGEGRLRVWSLVITIFGDMVQHRGGVISTGRLGQLLGRVGIEQGTLRTALSRLGRDGWVERERDGRTSLYRLSAQGLERFAPATTLIYAAPRRAPVTRWAMWVVLEHGAQKVRVGPADTAPPEADCVVTGSLGKTSDTFRQSLIGDDHRLALSALRSVLDALPDGPMSPLDAAAARMLLVHRWRRLVLRFPEIAPELLPPDLNPRDPRAAVARAYHRVTPQAESWLDTQTEGMTAMPTTGTAAATRFGHGSDGVDLRADWRDPSS